MPLNIEVRQTPHNKSFAGYCVEFYYSDILLAAVPVASPAYDALLKHYAKDYDIQHTKVAKNHRGQWVKSKVNA